MKQMVLVALFLAVFLPFGSMTALIDPGHPAGDRGVFAESWCCSTLSSRILENAMARVRFMKASAVTWAALGAAILSFVFYLANV